MNNLVLLCPFHPRAVHEGSWRVELDARGALRFFNPLGVRLPVLPAPLDIGGVVPRDASLALPVLSLALPKSSPALPMASSAPPPDSSTPLADSSAPAAHDSVWPAGTARTESVPGPEPRFGEVSGLTVVVGDGRAP